MLLAATGLLVACGLSVVGADGSIGSAEDTTQTVAPPPGVQAEAGEDGGAGVDGDDGDDAGDLGDATSLSDSPYDVAIDVVDATPDGACPSGAFACGAACVTSCLGCAGATLGCAGARACVDACSTCPGAAFECVTCAAGDTTVTASSCEKGPAECYAGTSHCACFKSGCPGEDQICHHVTGTQYECLGCGEKDTDEQPCANGGSCTAPAKSCD
jgi:hypothetical protein